MNGSFDVAQVCCNGHVVNKWSLRRPECNTKYCQRCGEKTITQCPNCSGPVLGPCCDPQSGANSHYIAPAFCKDCGSPFPWTEKRIAAVIALVSEDGGLAGPELEQFKTSVNEITKDSPNTQVAANRVKRLLTKVGKETARGIYGFIVDIASDTAKKIILPGA